jgi:hypothetical protein
MAKKKEKSDPDNYYAEGDINSQKRGSGARANRGKVSLSLVPLHLFAGAARVFMGGKLKYAPFNWCKGIAWSTCFDCLLRHLFKWFYCHEELDEESGEHHLDHAIANLLMLRHYHITYKNGDDRPPTFTGFAEALKDFNTCFNEEAYLKRNPEIQALIETRDEKD